MVSIVITQFGYYFDAALPGHEPETLKLHRMVFQAATRRELLTEARRADVNLLLSDPNGPALRGF